jgi:hypothetical protein
MPRAELSLKSLDVDTINTKQHLKSLNLQHAKSCIWHVEYEATNTQNKYFDIGESKNNKTTQSKLLYEGSRSDTHTCTQSISLSCHCKQNS